MVEGFSNDVFVVLGSCALSATFALIYDQYFFGNDFLKHFNRRQNSAGRYLPSKRDINAEFSETVIAVKNGQLPICPICLDYVRHAIETSCGHAFCGECFSELWMRKKTPTIACPMDRRKIYVVYASQALRAMAKQLTLLESRASIHLRSSLPIQLEQDRIDLQLQAYNIGARTLSSSVHPGFGINTMRIATASFREDLRWAARAGRQWRLLPAALSVKLALLPGLALLYIVAPIDLISEGVLGPLGLVDDVVMAVAVFASLGCLFRKAVLRAAPMAAAAVASAARPPRTTPPQPPPPRAAARRTPWAAAPLSFAPPPPALAPLPSAWTGSGGAGLAGARPAGRDAMMGGTRATAAADGARRGEVKEEAGGCRGALPVA